MARITWQNVTAPDLSTSRAALQQAGNSFNRGFEGFADTFRDIEQQQKDAYSQEALARLAQVSDPNQLNQMMASGGLASLGITDPRYLNADAMQNILGRPKTLFDNQNTAANTANTMSILNRRDAMLGGELAKQISDKAFVDAQTGEIRQNMDFAAQKLPKELKKLELANEQTTQQNRELRQRITINDAKEDRDQAKHDDDKNRLKKLEKQEENSNAFSAGISGLNTRKSIIDFFERAAENLETDKTYYNPTTVEFIRKGPDEYFKTIAATNAELRNATLASQGAGIAQRLTTENLGLNPAELIELASRRYGTNQALYKSIVENINALNQDQFIINPDLNDFLRNNVSVRNALTSNNEALNRNTAKFLENPAWGAVELLDSGTGIYRGKYEELLTALRDAGSEKGSKYWGINNNDVLNTIEDYVAQTGENPDLVAAAVLSGQGTEARNWIQRAVPFVADAKIDERKIEKEINKIKAAFNDPNILRSLAKARAERDRIESQGRQIDNLIRRAGLFLTRSDGISGSQPTALAQSELDKLIADIVTVRGSEIPENLPIDLPINLNQDRRPLNRLRP